MGERDFARPGAQPAADQRLQGRRMVGVAEVAPAGELAFAEVARQRAHHRGFQRLVGLERRQDAGQAGRQHRLARAGRADHQEIVAAGRGQLEHPLGAFLALDLGKIGIARAVLGDQRLGRGQDLLTAQMVYEGQQRRRGDDLRPTRTIVGVVGGVEATPSRFAAAHRGADQAAPRRPGGDGRRQHARYARERAVERQLAQHDVAREAVARDHAHGGQKPERDGQVVMAALLGEVGRREVDGDALRRQGKAERTERRAHPLATFAHRLVGQPDHGKGDVARRHQDLHIDRQDVDALERDGPNLCLHVRAPLFSGEQL